MALRLFCHGCEAERAVSKYGDGYICRTCLSTIRCLDCGARYTANCGEGSVFVPAEEPSHFAASEPESGVAE